VCDCLVIEHHPAAEHNHRRLVAPHQLAQGALRDLHLGSGLKVGAEGHGVALR
jgi:hypothetical protein